MLFNSPLSAQKADRLIDSLPLLSDERILDVGCGEAEFLIRVIEQKEGIGLGVDQNGGCISRARQAASGRISGKGCEFKGGLRTDNVYFDVGVATGRSSGNSISPYPGASVATVDNENTRITLSFG
ncbi:MAG: hypothetical protein AAF514_18935, partial [Verrucomicrobiota bacterium]